MRIDTTEGVYFCHGTAKVIKGHLVFLDYRKMGPMLEVRIPLVSILYITAILT